MKRVALIAFPWILALFLGVVLVGQFQVLRAERLRAAEWRAEMITRNEILQEALRIAAPNRWVSHDAKVQAARRVLAVAPAYTGEKGNPKVDNVGN